MRETKYKILRCRSITELNNKIIYYESKGWTRVGCTDTFNGMHVHTISIVQEIDDTEEITRPLG